MAIDKIAVRELVLYSENDSACYQRYLALFENYAKKKKRGVFNKEKAIKGIVNIYIPFCARKYRKDFGGFPRLTHADKMYMAKDYVFWGMWENQGLKHIKKARKIKSKRRKR